MSRWRSPFAVNNNDYIPDRQHVNWTAFSRPTRSRQNSIEVDPFRVTDEPHSAHLITESGKRHSLPLPGQRSSVADLRKSFEHGTLSRPKSYPAKAQVKGVDAPGITANAISQLSLDESKARRHLDVPETLDGVCWDSVLEGRAGLADSRSPDASVWRRHNSEEDPFSCSEERPNTVLTEATLQIPIAYTGDQDLWAEKAYWEPKSSNTTRQQLLSFSQHSITPFNSQYAAIKFQGSPSRDRKAHRHAISTAAKGTSSWQGLQAAMAKPQRLWRASEPCPTKSGPRPNSSQESEWFKTSQSTRSSPLDWAIHRRNVTSGKTLTYTIQTAPALPRPSIVRNSSSASFRSSTGSWFTSDPRSSDAFEGVQTSPVRQKINLFEHLRQRGDGLGGGLLTSGSLHHMNSRESPLTERKSAKQRGIRLLRRVSGSLGLRVASSFSFGVDGNSSSRARRTASDAPDNTFPPTHAVSPPAPFKRTTSPSDAVSKSRKSRDPLREKRRRLRRDRTKQKQQQSLEVATDADAGPSRPRVVSKNPTMAASETSSGSMAGRMRSMLRLGSGEGRDTNKARPVKERAWTAKTESGFAVRHANLDAIQEPKPRRPGQVKKIVNMYKDKASSMRSLGRTGGGACHGSC